MPYGIMYRMRLFLNTLMAYRIRTLKEHGIMGFRSIFQKIVIPMALIVSLLGAGILGIVGKLFRETYERQIYEENNNTASFVAQSVGSFMDMAYRISEQLANMDAVLTMDTDIQTPLLEGTVERNDYFELIYIQDMQGDQTGRSSGTLGNRANRWWFIQMLETGRPFVSKSYYSVNTNMACASIFLPLIKEGEEIGILATDIKLDKLQEAVAEFSDPDTGKISFIIDGEGVVVAHPEKVYYEELYNYQNMTRTVTKKDQNGKVLYDADGNIETEELSISISPEYEEMLKQVMNGKSGQGLIVDNGKEYYISYAPIMMDGYSDSWSVISLREKSESMRLMDKIFQAGVWATVAAVVLAVFLILFLTRTITKPIQCCLQRLTALSKGDLTTELPAVRGKDETAQLMAVLGETIQTLKGMIDDLTTQLHQIAQGDVTKREKRAYSGDFNELGKSLYVISASLNQSVRQVGEHSAKVYDSANALSGTAQQLADAAAMQAGAVGDLTAAVEDTSDKVHTSAKAAEKASLRMEQVNENMLSSNDAVMKLAEAMARMQEDSRKISGIAKTVQEIALQTNLLSLNASVEAARAGKAGKGFAVIAGEIRELAAHCAQAAEDTAAIIKTTLGEIRQSEEILNTTVSGIENSAVGVQEVNELVGDISAAAKMQVESMNQISEALDKISGAVQNNSAIAQESASSSVEMQEYARSLKQAVQAYHY